MCFFLRIGTSNLVEEGGPAMQWQQVSQEMGGWAFPPKIGVVFYPPKWMVYFMENPIKKWDDLGGP